MRGGFDSLCPHHFAFRIGRQNCPPKPRRRGTFSSHRSYQPRTPYPMKSPKSIVALIVLSLFAASVSFAADDKKEAVVSKEAPCCMKAEKAGKTCDHECCVAAAK